MTDKLICFVCHIINQPRCCWCLRPDFHRCHVRILSRFWCDVGITVINKCSFIVLEILTISLRVGGKECPSHGGFL